MVPPPPDPTPAGTPRWARLVLVSLVIQFVLLAGIQGWNDSLTFDEPFYITAGYTGITEQDLRINFEHPPLPKLAAAVPAVVFGDVGIPIVSAWHRGDAWNMSQLVVATNSRDIEQFVFLFRIIPILEAAAVGILIYLIGRRLFGWRAGLVSAALWLTSPIAVGFGHLNGLDIPGALALLLLAQLTLRYLDQATWGRLSWLGAGAAVALLTRSGIGMIGVVATVGIVGLHHLRRREWLKAARVGLVPIAGWLAVWATYWFLDPASSGYPIRPIQDALELEVESWWARIVLIPPWPDGFEAGIRFLSDFHQQEVSPGYLFGSPVDEVGAGFWVQSFLLKMTPVATVAIGAGLVAWRHLGSERIVRAALILGAPLLGWAVMMSQATRPFGVRYLIPGIVLLLIAAGPLERWIDVRAGAVVLAVAAVLQLGFLWQSHPHSLAWTAPGLGPGWQVAADANVDWGQDFYRLQDWAEDKEAPYISYFGFGPSFNLNEIPHAVSAHPNSVFAGTEPIPWGTEWVAISASNLNVFGFGPTSTMRDYCAVDIVGETILIYRFESNTPSGTSRDGEPRRPAEPCFDAEYSTLVVR